jgi:hypothetical protein
MIQIMHLYLITKFFALDNLDRYNESMTFFQRLTIDPNDKVILNNKRFALKNLGSNNEAIPTLINLWQ